MASITIRNLPDEVHRALRVRAALGGRSTEAEVREILATAVMPEGRIKLGSLLLDIGHELSGVELKVERDKTPAIPLGFE